MVTREFLCTDSQYAIEALKKHNTDNVFVINGSEDTYELHSFCAYAGMLKRDENKTELLNQKLEEIRSNPLYQTDKEYYDELINLQSDKKHLIKYDVVICLIEFIFYFDINIEGFDIFRAYFDGTTDVETASKVFNYCKGAKSYYFLINGIDNGKNVNYNEIMDLSDKEKAKLFNVDLDIIQGMDSVKMQLIITLYFNKIRSLEEYRDELYKAIKARNIEVKSL